MAKMSSILALVPYLFSKQPRKVSFFIHVPLVYNYNGLCTPTVLFCVLLCVPVF